MKVTAAAAVCSLGMASAFVSPGALRAPTASLSKVRFYVFMIKTSSVNFVFIVWRERTCDRQQASELTISDTRAAVRLRGVGSGVRFPGAVPAPTLPHGGGILGVLLPAIMRTKHCCYVIATAALTDQLQHQYAQETKLESIAGAMVPWNREMCLRLGNTHEFRRPPYVRIHGHRA